MQGGRGGTCSFFSEEKKEPKKSRLAVLPHMLLSSVVLGSYIREVTLLSCAACLAQSQRRLLFPCLRLTLAIICIRFGIPRMDVFLFRQFAPAPCSPPLGGSDGYSAVRFTPAGKYGGRENWPSGRDTGCMSGHPRRAHHKLKWARKGQSGLGVLYELIPRSESSKTIIAVKNRSKAPLPSSASPLAQTPTGHPCLTGVGNNPLIVIKHHQCAVSRMPQARRSRSSLIRCAGCATLPLLYINPLSRLRRRASFPFR